MKYLVTFLLILSSLYSLDLEKPKVYSNQNISNWYMSEKLDGIRAFWDGEKLYTKNGNIINTPKTFTKNFPKFHLDGELWTKRDDFENIQNIVLDKNPSSKWSEITYNIFEAPNLEGDFKNRLYKIKLWFSLNHNENINLIPQYICKNKKDLDKFLEKIITKKGEGIIIKNPNLTYINKRNENILKVKKFYDMEGLVVDINYNNSKMKSLVLKLEDGTIFNLGNGFSDEERVNHPKIGDTVTFKYYDFTKNSKPKFASFLRVREKE